MKHTALFIHLLGFSVWVGSFIAMMICLIYIRKSGSNTEMIQMLNRLQTRLTIIGNSGALLMLISGLILYSLTKTYTLPIYLTAAIGGGTCVFSIWAITFQSNRLSERIKSTSAGKSLTTPITLMNVSSWVVLIGIAVVVGIATR
ncbi:hypothetical protein NZD89_20095 [Alicyclobacillus fastidiosus]|uniref:DUF2269 family protein n=1 Tax=Alicyclobacillus fastidiosus TaxID=392011 RepID=A0ABY6ZCH5_9BACL|nr:hypothetical protein [Alicyclobacillus fastidiosus]WAH40598.1 hypothetical protein NZD89_20095 [Alicyclobacillus fastidiosus]